MLVLHVMIQPFRKRKWPCLTPFYPAVKQPFVCSHVFSHDFNDFEYFTTGLAGQLLNCGCWVMFGLEMSNKCLFGGIPPVAFLTPVPFLLPYDFRWRSSIALEERILLHLLHKQPVSPVWVFIWCFRLLELLKLWQQS